METRKPKIWFLDMVHVCQKFSHETHERGPMLLTQLIMLVMTHPMHKGWRMFSPAHLPTHVHPTSKTQKNSYLKNYMADLNHFFTQVGGHQGPYPAKRTTFNSFCGLRKITSCVWIRGATWLATCWHDTDCLISQTLLDQSQPYFHTLRGTLSAITC